MLEQSGQLLATALSSSVVKACVDSDLSTGSITAALYLGPLCIICVQDLYRRLSSPRALQGILRIRTSPEFRVSRAYGQLFQDEQYDNLAHIPACSPHSTFAFEFQHGDAGGFATTSDAPPMVQMVFQYSVLVSDTASSTVNGTGNSQQQTRYVVVPSTSKL